MEKHKLGSRKDNSEMFVNFCSFHYIIQKQGMQQGQLSFNWQTVHK